MSVPIFELTQYGIRWFEQAARMLHPFGFSHIRPDPDIYRFKGWDEDETIQRIDFRKAHDREGQVEIPIR